MTNSDNISGEYRNNNFNGSSRPNNDTDYGGYDANDYDQDDDDKDEDDAIKTTMLTLTMTMTMTMAIMMMMFVNMVKVQFNGPERFIKIKGIN